MIYAVITPIDISTPLPDEKDLPFYTACTKQSTYYLVTSNKNICRKKIL